jgi:pimeloyl-ACP methyl ester carboxylesterase
MNTRLKRMQVNGIELNVMFAGESNDGPTVLLVHGFPDDHTVWRHQVPALVAAGYRVVAPDTRGCGDSEVLPAVSDYRMDKLVADLVGLLDVLVIAQVQLVAHDWGAFQAWHFALRHPQRVERYIAMSVGHPSAYARGGLAQKLKGYYILAVRSRLMDRLLPLANWALFRLMTQYPAEFAHWKAQLERPGRLGAGLNYYRANPEMTDAIDHGRAQVPVVGLWSEGDLFLAEGQMRRTGDWCDAGYTYERVAGANHWLQLDAPEKVNTLLLRHLN